MDAGLNERLENVSARVSANDPLRALENVVCAPHLAWLTQETLERSIAAAWRNVERLRSGAPLENRVA